MAKNRWRWAALALCMGCLVGCGDDEIRQISGEGDADVVETDAAESDAEEEVELGLPETLPFSFVRDEPGEPIPDADVRAFTERLVGLMAKIGYFDWIRRTSHGVDASTGKEDWTVWWTTTHAEKSGDTVTFVHNETNEPDSADGGHNLMTRTIKILGSAMAGYLMTGDESMARLAEQYCKGVTAQMEGMVYDENDELHHLMARNIVAFNHDFTTFDGYKASVDYSNWYHEGQGWNCHRFEFPNNPKWGSVWVTNMRSKDDVSRMMRITGTMRYAVEYAEDDAMRAACTDAWEHLHLFFKDIVDHDYWIRTKDKYGKPFIPGLSGDEQLDADAGDLASYGAWDELIPNAMCNAKRAVAYNAYGEGLDNDCGLASGNPYEEAAINVHYFNIWLIRSHHLARIYQALIHHDVEDAKVGLEGLVERNQRYRSIEEAELPKTKDEFDRDLASSLMQSLSLGYPLDEEEARMVMAYYERAVEKYNEWPHWNLWDASIPDGSYDYRPPNYGSDDGLYWIRIEDFPAFLDACWSPFRNPDGVQILDCDLVRDPSKWDPSVLD